MKIQINGSSYEVSEGERLVDAINRMSKGLPQVCYHPQLGPIQTCDTCLVEVNGKLARACGTQVAFGMQVLTESAVARAAQDEAFDRILGIIFFTAPFAITTTAIARFITPPSCWPLSISKRLTALSRTKSIIPTRFIGMIRTNAFSAGVA
jgi:hypothetical protein